MLSMDDVYERMQYFARALGRFQDALAVSLADLDRCHAAVDPLWRDAMRREYDDRYGPLHDALVRYVRVQGPGFQAFLGDKLRAIDQYLHG